MKRVRNSVLLILCVAMLICVSAAGTLAYLQSKTDPVTNTMTVGKVEITLDETDVDLYCVQDGETRVTKNDYKLIPGRIYKKDPTIHIQKGSEPCYLFVKVENGIADIEGSNTVASQMQSNGWCQIENSNIWYHKEIWDAREATENLDVVIFTEFCVTGEGTNETIADYDGKSVAVTAYAVQADGFDSATEAWAASFGAGNP